MSLLRHKHSRHLVVVKQRLPQTTIALPALKKRAEALNLCPSNFRALIDRVTSSWLAPSLPAKVMREPQAMQHSLARWA